MVTFYVLVLLGRQLIYFVIVPLSQGPENVIFLMLFSFSHA